MNNRKVEFRVSDIVNDENLPTDLVFVYSKRLLVPIHEGENDNMTRGQEGVKLAVQNIAKSLRRGGWLIASEKAIGLDFHPFFEQAGLNVISASRFERGDIGTQGRITLYKSQNVRYVCTKR